MMILADAATAQALTIGAWVVGGAAVLGFFTQVITTFALKRDLDLVNKRVDNLEVDLKGFTKALGDMETRVNERGEQRAGLLHEKINDILPKLVSVLNNTKQLHHEP